MAHTRTVPVELSELLQDQERAAMKGLVSAPIGYRADRLAALARAHNPTFGTLLPAELVAALLHQAPADGKLLSDAVVAYRNARVWETRATLGEATDKEGQWDVPVKAPGQQAV